MKKGSISTVSVILSEMKNVSKLKHIYDRFPEVMETKERRERATIAGKNELETASVGIPSLVE